MPVSGRTRAIFDRYNIINEADQLNAVRRVQEYTQAVGQFSDKWATSYSSGIIYVGDQDF